MSLIQLLLISLVRLLKVCTVLSLVTVKVTGNLSQIIEGLYCLHLVTMKITGDHSQINIFFFFCT